MTSRRALQALLALVGVVAVTAGLAAVLFGVHGVLDGGPVSANVDSELRFFGAWYAAAGVLALRAAKNPETERTAVLVVSGGYLVAACGRLLSVLTHGWPHPVFVTLTAVEFVLAFALPPWHAAVVRRS